MNSLSVTRPFLLFICLFLLSSYRTEDPKTVAESISELKAIFAKLGYPFKPNVSNAEIIFGLQHTIAEQRQPDSVKGKKFLPTPEYMAKIVSYYRSYVDDILTNKSDTEIIGIYVKILQDLTIMPKESSYSNNTENLIQEKNNLGTRGYFIAENREDHPTEVNTDPMLLAKEKDGMNEGIGFTIDGKELIFMKQYLASLLTPKD